MATERPKYSTELSEPPFEIRQYAPTIVAAVHIDGTREDAVNAGFRILASYIFGNNEMQQKIAMTAPVTQGTRIAMTAPVEQNEAQTGWEIRFTMPSGYTLSTLPKPRDPRVELIPVPGRRMAALTFSGFWSDSNLQSHRSQLLDFLEKRQLTALSMPIYAYYDPPWTPWFWRTNEVMVEIAGSGR
jgi:DNA gyrase inhibitor GyrI